MTVLHCLQRFELILCQSECGPLLVPIEGTASIDILLSEIDHRLTFHFQYAERSQALNLTTN